jgi:hypothetical protein
MKMKAGTSHPARQCHIPEDCNPLYCSVFYIHSRFKILILLLQFCVTGLYFACNRSNESTACGSSGNHRKSNSLDASSGGDGTGGRRSNKPLVTPVRER